MKGFDWLARAHAVLGTALLIAGLMVMPQQNAFAAVINQCSIGSCTATGTPASDTDPTGCGTTGACNGGSDCECKVGVRKRPGQDPICEPVCPEPLDLGQAG